MKHKQPFWSKEIRNQATAFLAMVAMAAFFLLPIPYYIEQPGSAESLRTFVQVDGETDTNAGNFMLTTVGMKQATSFTAILSYFQPFKELESKEAVMGNSSDDEYDQIQEYYMTSSKNAAIQVAFELAKQPYHYEYKGIYVMAVEDNSNFKSSLSIGDTISEIDGKAFQSSKEFIEYVKKKKVGQKVTIGYEHKGEKKTVTAPLTKLKGKDIAGIGITLVDHTEIKTNIPVDIDAGSIGGPSAGLMFTLETYSILSNQDLRKGHEIAGTGTMNEAGEVGQIGGIDKKVVAADAAGADIFFAPDQEVTKEEKEQDPTAENNYDTAKKAAKKIGTKMKIVPVKNVQDALDYMEKLKSK